MAIAHINSHLGHFNELLIEIRVVLVALGIGRSHPITQLWTQ